MRRLLLAAALLLTAGTAVWWYRQAGPAAVLPPVADAPAGPQADPIRTGDILPSLDMSVRPPSARSSAAVQHAQPRASLPDSKLPFAEQLEPLLEAAKKGQGEAICRLVAARSACAMGMEAGMVHQSMVEAIKARDDLPVGQRQVNVLAMIEERQDRVRQQCGGLDVERIPQPHALLGSLAGLSTRQKVILALLKRDGSVLRLPRAGFEAPIPPSLDGGPSSFFPQWQSDHAVAFLYDGYAAGDPLALEGLIALHIPVTLPSLDTELRPRLPDLKRFVMLAQLYVSLFGEEALGEQVSSYLYFAKRLLTADEAAEVEAAVATAQTRWQSLLSDRARRKDPASLPTEPAAWEHCLADR